jgi:hypothetical protein
MNILTNFCASAPRNLHVHSARMRDRAKHTLFQRSIVFVHRCKELRTSAIQTIGLLVLNTRARVLFKRCSAELLELALEKKKKVSAENVQRDEISMKWTHPKRIDICVAACLKFFRNGIECWRCAFERSSLKEFSLVDAARQSQHTATQQRNVATSLKHFTSRK